MRFTGPPNRSVPRLPLFLCAIIFTGLALLLLNLSSIDPPSQHTFPVKTQIQPDDSLSSPPLLDIRQNRNVTSSSTCATVEEMGNGAAASDYVSRTESLRVRRLIRDHFELHGASRVRGLPPEQFCRQGFVLGKASEAGFGNEMYKLLTAAGLSIILNRSLIIGKTRHIGPLAFHYF